MDEQENVAQPETIRVPVYAVRTALTVAGERGVYVHAAGTDYRIVATDGKRLFAFSHPIPRRTKVPGWAAKGIVIPEDGLKERLDLFLKLEFEDMDLAYAEGAPYGYMHDPSIDIAYRFQPLDATFPDYQKVLEQCSASLAGREVDAMASVAYQAGYLKDVSMIAKMLGSETARFYGSSSGSASMITFPPGSLDPNKSGRISKKERSPDSAVLVLMPMRSESPLGIGASRIMSGAVQLTIKALRAHQTRWRQRLDGPSANKRTKAEAETKITEYEDRIKAIMVEANAQAALPAPEEPEPTVEEPVEQSVDFSLALAIEAEPATAPEPAEAPNMAAVYRSALTPAQQRKAKVKFVADLNAALSKAEAGYTVNQLADGVPIDDWFDIGMSPEDAAARCPDWRRMADVLPPDEVQPGEENKPAGLLKSKERQPKANGHAPVTEAPAPRRRAPRADRGAKRGAQRHAKRKTA